MPTVASPFAHSADRFSTIDRIGSALELRCDGRFRNLLLTHGELPGESFALLLQKRNKGGFQDFAHFDPWPRAQSGLRWERVAFRIMRLGQGLGGFHRSAFDFKFTDL